MLSEDFGRIHRPKQGYSSPQIFFIPVPPRNEQLTRRSAGKKPSKKGNKAVPKPVKSEETKLNALLTYCDDTSLHGFKYFAKPKLNKIERSFWVVALAVVYVLVTYLLWGQIFDFIESPVLISFEPEPTLISTLPFPAITLCPDMQVRKDAFNLTAASQPGVELNEDEMGLLLLSSALCDMVFHRNQKHDAWTWFYPQAIKNFSYAHVSYEKCRDFVVNIECAMKDIPDPCFYFQPSYTEQGACFSYNLLPLTQLFKPAGSNNFYDESPVRRDPIWSPDNGYEVPRRKQIVPTIDGSPPWAVSDSAVVTGYNFYLKVPLHIFNELCLGARGFHGFIHNPAETPNSRHTYFYLSPNQHLDIKVEPRVSTASPALIRWPPQSRMCYLQYERQLLYFTFYTQKNCELECTANFSLQHCNCIPINLPRAEGTRVCAPRAWNCLSKHAEESDSYGARCNCLPACTEIEYGAQFTSVEKDWTERNYMPQNKSHDVLHMSLRIHYRTKYVQAIKRSSSKTFIDLVADVGGLISLFTGFSILSLAEIFHHLFLKKLEGPETPAVNPASSAVDGKIGDASAIPD